MSAGPGVGQILGHYRILEQIGKGGMGVVYRAHDDRLEREVAIKVLPPGSVADDTARRRFRREALTLSKLNHPNIAVVHDFDIADGVAFLVMELIPGESLDAKLTGRPLPENEICRLGAQMAEGLSAAHAAGVVHRDLKPANLRVCPDGRLKILDFGLAKAVESDALDGVTADFEQTRSMAGTFPYMAPEQLRAEALDHRTDIDAAGAVLYEMATGQRPFTETQSARLIDAVLNRPPTPPRSLNPAISQEVERIILKCLEKDRVDRYQSAQDLSVDLRRLRATATMPVSAVVQPRAHRQARWRTIAIASTTFVFLAVIGIALIPKGHTPTPVAGPAALPTAAVAPTQTIQSLAVLPLENLSRDKDQEFFADGMTDELITDLGKIDQLRVISRTSVMQFKGQHKPLPEIGRELKVDAIIEGTVARSRDRVRITTRLIRLPNETVVWQKQSDERNLRDVLALQEEVARSVAQEIRIKLSAEQQARLTAAHPVNPDAYDYYLRGRQTIWQFKGSEAISYFQKAIVLDPGYAPAYAGLADAYVVAASGAMLPATALPKARDAAQKALALDDSLSEAHAANGWVRLIYDYDWPGAETEFRKAIEFKPGNATARFYLSLLLAVLGRHQEAISEAQNALNLDPLDVTMQANLGWRYQSAGKLAEALAVFKRLQIAHPEQVWIGVDVAQCHACLGKLSEAYAALGPERPDPDWLTERALLDAASGKTADARIRLGQLLVLRQRNYVPASMIGSVLAALGGKQEALDWLERAFAEHDLWLLSTLEFSCTQPLRNEPRFLRLKQRMHLP